MKKAILSEGQGEMRPCSSQDDQEKYFWDTKEKNREP